MPSMLVPWLPQCPRIGHGALLSLCARTPSLSDFVYVDARHDYCGAYEDIALYWPKVSMCVEGEGD